MISDLKKINKKNSRRNPNIQEPKFVERLIKISRVSKVTKGGKKLSFRAIVVVGDENGKVGVGFQKDTSKSAADYLMEHTSAVLLLDADGKLRLMFPYGTTGQQLASDTKLFIR